MSIFPKKETPYDKSKEFLDKQQKIDLLLVLVRICETGPTTGADNVKAANKLIEKTLEQIK